MAKRKPNEERVQLSFLREDDLKLYKFMVKEAYRCRWDLATFCIASLQEAFKDRIDDEDVSAIAEEAARKVRERTVAVVETPPEPTPVAAKPSTVSMESAMQQAEQQIAALNPPGMKLKRGKIQPPQMPKEK